MSAVASPGQPRGEGAHLPVLDGVRGLAILLVMQYHFYALSFGIINRAPTLTIDRWARHAAGVGWSGVDLFFVLSGFLITGILYDAKSSSRYFRNFYARRVLRIAPLYYAFLMFVLLALPHLQPLDGPARIDQLRANQGWYWTYLVNVALAFPHLGATIGPASNHFWSLAVEEQFYLLWPLAVLVFARRRLMMLCVVLMLTAFGLRVALTWYGTSSQFLPDAAYLLLPTRMDTLATGAFLALAARGSPGELQRYARFALAAAGMAIVVLASIFVARGGLTTIDPPVETIGFSALAVLYASLLAVVVTSPRGATANRLFPNRVLGFFGRYAYGLYVVHLLVAYEVAVRIDVE